MPIDTLADAAALLGEGSVDEPTDESNDVGEALEELGKFVDESVKVADDVDFTNPETLETETAKPEPPVVEPPKPVIDDSKEKRKQEMELRLERLANKRKEQTLAKRLEEERRIIENQRAEIEAARREAEELQTTWRSATKDPVEAFRKLGLSPTEAFDKITQAAVKDDSPEAREARKLQELRESIIAEFKPVIDELNNLKGNQSKVQEELARRAHLENLAHQKATEKEFLRIANSPGYEELADYYEESDLVMLGNHLADEMSQSGHRFQNGIKDVLDELTSRLRTQLKRAEERRTKRTAPPPVAATTPSGDAKPANATKTIGNAIAGSTANSGTRARTEQERRLEAVKMLKATMQD